MFSIQPVSYFIQKYGHKRGITVMHRLRTWYNQKARAAAKPGPNHDAAAAYRYDAMALVMTDRIQSV